MPQRRNHNPLWRITDTLGETHHVRACDERQAADYLERALGRFIARIVREAGGET